jgi:hypothetical protein
MNPNITRLINLLEDPAEEWKHGDCVFANLKRDIQIWTANIPVLDTNTYPVPMSIGLLDKWRLWRAVRTARNNYWHNYWLRKLNP